MFLAHKIVNLVMQRSNQDLLKLNVLLNIVTPGADFPFSKKVSINGKKSV